MEQELHVLLIDDDEDDALLISDMLKEIERIKLVFHWARTYEQGREILNQGDWNAILVDYDLGGKNGLDFIREANRQDVQAPMIMVTGRGRYEIDLEAMHAGAADYVSKNELNSSFLERTIRYAIERQKVEEDLEQQVQERTRALQTTLKLFEGLFEASPDAILLVSPDGRIQRANGQAQAIFGYPVEEMQGKLIEELIPQRFRAGHVQNRKEYTQNPRRRPMGIGLSLFGLRKDGREFAVDVTLSPLEVDERTHVICVVRDVSDRSPEGGVHREA